LEEVGEMTKIYLKVIISLCALLLCATCYAENGGHPEIMYPIHNSANGEEVVGPDDSLKYGIRVYIAESISTPEMKIKIDTTKVALFYKGYTVLLRKGGSDILSINGYGCVNKFGTAMFELSQSIQKDLESFISLSFVNKDLSLTTVSIDLPKYRAAANKHWESGKEDVAWFNGIGKPLSKLSEEKFSSQFDCL
jgi:hypothetical protein